jgi:hypothetical protein
MDALYGVTFKLANVSEEVLAESTTSFGPLSFQTVHRSFTSSGQERVTDRTGHNPYDVETPACFPFDCLHIHGRENGLVDVETAYAVTELFRPKSPQDCPHYFEYESVRRHGSSGLPHR